jgi:hypothetical protein
MMVSICTTVPVESGRSLCDVPVITGYLHVNFSKPATYVSIYIAKLNSIGRCFIGIAFLAVYLVVISKTALDIVECPFQDQLWHNARFCVHLHY